MALLTRMYGPAARCKRFRQPVRCGLASMYPASDWSVWCSGPSWISARMRSFYRTGLERAIRVTSVRMRREDRSSIVVSSSRRPRRVRDIGYVIDSSYFALFLCSCLAVVPLSRPARADATRARAVRAGRRAVLPSCSTAARPRLDGPEHGATIKQVGTPSPPC
jgi:hypothetical protein